MFKARNIVFALGAFCVFALPAMAQTPPKQPAAQTPLPNAQSEQAQKYMRDYKISKKDFMVNVEKSFDNMDKNHDGFISMQEISANNGQVMNPGMQNMASQAYNPPSGEDDDEETAPPAPQKGAAAGAASGQPVPKGVVPPASSIPPVGR